MFCSNERKLESYTHKYLVVRQFYIMYLMIVEILVYRSQMRLWLFAGRKRHKGLNAYVLDGFKIIG